MTTLTRRDSSTSLHNFQPNQIKLTRSSSIQKI
jgi:hypothetical protein